MKPNYNIVTTTLILSAIRRTKLFKQSILKIMELTTLRPSWNESIKKELAKIVGEKLNEWCNDDTDLEDCIESAENVLEWHHNADGYELAKEFEDEGFSPDSALVELLDDVSYDKRSLIEASIKKWVLDNSLTLELKEGDTVMFKQRNKEIVGEIVKLYPETMQYGIWYEYIGYKKGSGHTIVNFENAVHQPTI